MNTEDKVKLESVMDELKEHHDMYTQNREDYDNAKSSLEDATRELKHTLKCIENFDEDEDDEDELDTYKEEKEQYEEQITDLKKEIERLEDDLTGIKNDLLETMEGYL